MLRDAHAAPPWRPSAHFPSLSPAFLPGTCPACWFPLSLHCPPYLAVFPIPVDTSLPPTQATATRRPRSEYQFWHLLAIIQNFSMDRLCYLRRLSKQRALPHMQMRNAPQFTYVIPIKVLQGFSWCLTIHFTFHKDKQMVQNTKKILRKIKREFWHTLINMYFKTIVVKNKVVLAEKQTNRSVGWNRVQESHHEYMTSSYTKI